MGTTSGTRRRVRGGDWGVSGGWHCKINIYAVNQVFARMKSLAGRENVDSLCKQSAVLSSPGRRWQTLTKLDAAPNEIKFDDNITFQLRNSYDDNFLFVE